MGGTPCTQSLTCLLPPGRTATSAGSGQAVPLWVLPGLRPCLLPRSQRGPEPPTPGGRGVSGAARGAPCPSAGGGDVLGGRWVGGRAAGGQPPRGRRGQGTSGGSRGESEF